MSTLLRRIASFAALAVLAACGSDKPTRTATPAANGPAVASRPSVATPVHGQRASYDHVDQYKADVADLIMRYNTAHTFSGQLPPMLPAIVVLSITVDKDGRMSKVGVQRSRDGEASKVALASMQRVGALPKPYNLASRGALTFSETFLFNADYRFQLRTLAGVQ
jgi:protein TonB